MKVLLIFVLLVAIGLLWMDDRSQRAAVEQAQQQVQQLTTERDQLSQRITAAPSPKPDWFQQRLEEAPALTTGTVGGNRPN